MYRFGELETHIRKQVNGGLRMLKTHIHSEYPVLSQIVIGKKNLLPERN